MSIVRFTGEVLPDGTIQPPEGIRLAPGKAEVVVATAEVGAAPNSLRSFAGAIRSGDVHSADNDRIDADLARAYDDSHPEAR
jgi:hypothetical protein